MWYSSDCCRSPQNNQIIESIRTADTYRRKHTISRVLIIGCGGVASVAIQKCCQNDAVFTEICIASRTVSKCDALKAKIEAEAANPDTEQNQDDGDTENSVAINPDVVLNQDESELFDGEEAA